MSRVLLALLVGLLIGGCSQRGPELDAVPPTRAEIWAELQPIVERYRLDPGFVYAIVAAESNFDPRARRGDARGLMQIKPAAWSAVSIKPYEPTVWQWRENLAVGIDYLAYVRSSLHRQNRFSYPRLLAAFHYGPDHLEERNYDLDRLKPPPNDIYRQLWQGNLNPVPPPAAR